MEDTVQSLEDALKANRQVQAAVVVQLRQLAERKAKNRRKAADMYRHIGLVWRREDERTTPVPPEPLSLTTIRQLHQRSEGRKEKMTPHKKKALIRKWQHDTHRKWNRRFFVDPDGSIPEPNEDTVKRRKLEENKIFYHLCPTWTKKETSCLMDLVGNKDDDDENVNFERIPPLLQKASAVKPKRGAPIPMSVLRTVEECRLWYQGQKRTKKPFTKEESLQIMEFVHKHKGNPPWKDLNLTGRSPWQCFVAYQSRLSNSKKSAWTEAEDELLFKYLAAMGPQFVLHLGSVADISTSLLPDKMPKVILGRANASQLNPNISRDMWPDDDDRKLVLCMKAYRDEPSPLVSSALHFPHRMSKSVTEKWQRSLNPDFTSRLPFTKEEDDAILAAVRDKKGWAEMAKDFPGRHPRTLQGRWTDLVGSKQLLENYQDRLKQNSARRGGDLLNADDFVLRVKKTKEKTTTASQKAQNKRKNKKQQQQQQQQQQEN